MSASQHNERKGREALLFSCAAGPLGYLAWGVPQMLAAFLALCAAALLAGAMLAGFDYRFLLGWGKWVLWAAQALYHGRLAHRDADAQATMQQALADHGWATPADTAAARRQLQAHLARVVALELGLLALAALALGALMAFDDDGAIWRSFATATLWNKLIWLQGVYAGLGIICAVALFGWTNGVAALDRLYLRRLQRALQR